MAAFLSQNFDPTSLAAQGEHLAAQFYQQRGWQILGSNMFNNRGLRAGEIDFVAIREGVVCFVEVKTRRRDSGKFGSAAESIDYFKQKNCLKP